MWYKLYSLPDCFCILVIVRQLHLWNAWYCVAIQICAMLLLVNNSYWYTRFSEVFQSHIGEIDSVSDLAAWKHSQFYGLEFYRPKVLIPNSKVWRYSEFYVHCWSWIVLIVRYLIPQKQLRVCNFIMTILNSTSSSTYSHQGCHFKARDKPG